MRTGLSGTLAAFVVLCAASCGKRPVSPTPTPDPESAKSATPVRITVRVAGMTKALEITGREGPNRVEEALSGLRGVTVLDDRDYLKDDLYLRYDPGKVTPERIIEVIREQGFQATIVENPKAKTDKPLKDSDNG